MMDDMCWRAHAAANTAGVVGCTEFKRGEMEAIPLPDESVDVVNYASAAK
jgi:ubiquinone/menaquinone biosynthesis C-methylase UbiE